MIFLRDIWVIENVNDYKLHFAQYNDNEQPLDVFVRDQSAWQEWNEYFPNRNDFNRHFIFSFIHFYPDENRQDRKEFWLFGGIFQVLSRPPNTSNYEIELTDQGEAFIGRLKLHYNHGKGLPIRPKLETYYNRFEVSEILREPYSGAT